MYCRHLQRNRRNLPRENRHICFAKKSKTGKAAPAAGAVLIQLRHEKVEGQSKMRRNLQTDQQVGVEQGSGNVYRDLGFRNPDAMKLKATLVSGIRAVIEQRQLSGVEAARIIGIPELRLSRLLIGQFERISREKLIESLDRLDQNVSSDLRK
ncbi:helix-turn-helix transcriptional regulator [Hydrocarboniphaga sp.]|uniref:helix-turn-helix domain-containing protein n=1 Tax=Hydrocarboniphaga sp. TaxID=2033016 RepID=UPI0026046765|nr:helix-turn-helix transcriptional regulator [Hydrocarboniphaga sp.]